MSLQIAGSPGQSRSRPAIAPGSRLGAEERDRRARVAMGQRDLGHSAMPSMAAAEMSASLTPGAQAMSGLPLVRPSPLEKIADVAAGLADQQNSRETVPRVDVVLDIAVAPSGGDIGEAERARAGAERRSA